jgi:hypothetical protein
MPTPIGQVFNDLAIKAGISADSPALKSLLASPELVNVQVPDELITGIDNGLLSLDAAKNNHPDIKKKYFADAYDGMDKQLLSLVANDTFDQADIDEIKAEKSTSKKAELIVTKLKAAKAQAKGADKEEINRQLAAAHETARIAKAEVETVKNTYEGKIKDIQLNAAIKSVFGNYKTIYDDLPAAVKTATLQAIITQGLQDKNAELRTDEQGNLQLVSKDGSNVFGENHVQLTPQSFLDKTFAPILKVSGPAPAAQHRQQQTIIPTKGNEGAEANASFVKSHTDQVLADMAAPKSVMI